MSEKSYIFNLFLASLMQFSKDLEFNIYANDIKHIT